MSSDPRVKRLLKRYRKDNQFVDASIDVSNIQLSDLLRACGLRDEQELTSPKELNDNALGALEKLMGLDFDRQSFDYYMHSYVRTEYVSTYYDDPVVTSKPAPEGGPPSKIPLPDGTQWVSVRPKDGQEQYEAHEFH
jgi:hypothetical protein